MNAHQRRIERRRLERRKGLSINEALDKRSHELLPLEGPNKKSQLAKVNLGKLTFLGNQHGPEDEGAIPVNKG